ncbi:MAG: trigger factor [Bacilli bacterium]|nr:trigger factor [Bacilli bacterium]
MERKVTKLEHGHVQVDVVVDEKSWKEAQDKAFNKLAENVTIDGFRKGKAPKNLVKSHVDPMKVLDEAINALLPVIYQDIIEKDGVRPYARPQVDVTKVSDTELEVKFLLAVAPEVKLGQYKGLEIGKKEVKVTKKDVEQALEDTLKENASLVVKESEAALGDTVVMDFVGKVNGEVFEGGSAENHELELGSHQFIPGFEEQLVGHKAGEKVVVNVKFPENYTEELKGKDATFDCTIHEVKAKKLPELNDEFVKELKVEGIETVEAFRARKEEDLKKQKENEARREYMGKLVEQIVKNSKLDIASEIIDNQVESRKEDMVKRIEQNGLKLEQYLQILGQSEEQFLAQIREMAVKETSEYVVLEEIGRVEKLEVSDEDLEAEYKKISEQYKMKVEDVKKALANNLGEFKNNLKMQRIDEFLYNENK